MKQVKILEINIALLFIAVSNANAGLDLNRKNHKQVCKSD